MCIRDRDKGYECAALMVEFSVYNSDYSESVTDSSTPLLDKLNTTTVFNNYKNKVLNLSLIHISAKQPGNMTVVFKMISLWMMV